MARSVVPGFSHTPGVHCGSTALADLWRSAGISEAMAFGLGRGAHFYSLKIDGPRPVRNIYGRSLSMEFDACQALGARYDEEREPFGGRTWERLRAHLDVGRTPLVCCDVGRLPYYGGGGSFNGHRLVLAGQEDGTALVADTHFPDLLALPVPVLVHAMESDAPPILIHEAAWILIGPPARPVDAELVVGAVRDLGARVLGDESGFGGLGGLRNFAADLPGWASLPDAGRLLRAGYQLIEKRGTGGGMFRRLYLAFLREGARLHPPLAGMAVEVEAAASAWTALALELRAQSDRETPQLARAVALAGEVLAAEEGWLRSAAQMA